MIEGVFVSIAASYGVQRYRDVYVIPPEKEQTFPFLANKQSESDKFRNIILGDSKTPVLLFSDLSNEKLAFHVLNNGTVLSLTDVEHYEFGTPGSENGGKLTFYYNYAEVILNYIIHPNSSVTILSTVDGKRPDGKPNDLEFSVTEGEEEPVVLPLGTEIISYPGVTLPKAYLELVESAYGFVENSINVKQSTEIIGLYNNFTQSHNTFYLEPHGFSLKQLDDQVFGLMTLSKLESADTLRVLKSWINTANELGYMGNQIDNGSIVLSKIQAPVLFQLIKELQDNSLFKDELPGLSDNLEFIAEHTWKNSIGTKGLVEVKWLGNSNGIFGFEEATPKDSSSFELFCLLGDMSRVIQKLHEASGNSLSTKWGQRFNDFEATMSKYWNDENKHYGDLVKVKVESGPASHVPVILGLLTEKSDSLKQLLENLQQDSNFLPFGFQYSEEQGVRVGTNYLLIKSLKKYSSLSGPSQELAHNLYSISKNHLAAVIARSNRATKSFYGRYDKNMKQIGQKGHPEGTLVFNIMSNL
uniref:Glycogen debranching enzyme n=1 Tax=Caenorhabditis tropicalis TaxID=1561998 RepID=A0A1I7SXD4_9PELO